MDDPTHHGTSTSATNLTNGNASHSPATSTQVLVIGAGPVGCLSALKLAQAGIDVEMLEKQEAISEAPRACGYYGTVQGVFHELGGYEKICKEGFKTRGLAWRGRPVDDGMDFQRDLGTKVFG
jgi:2-polyprenyl-6-methoxyphenol hydroxylase-like FAD-dependent oxidoreductase